MNQIMATNRCNRIAVIGGGVIGLSTAYKLLSENSNIELSVFSDKSSPDTTGDVAAGWIYTSKIKGSEKETKRWFDETCKHLSSLYKSYDSLETGITPISGFLFDAPDADLEVCGELAREATNAECEMFLSFDWTKKYRSVHLMTTWSCKCMFYLPWLTQKIKDLGGKVIKEHIKSFSDLPDFDIIINCTGLGAQSLASDDQIYPIKGQVFCVEAPWIKHFYCLSKCLYVLPRLNDVIVGGTRDKNNYDTNPDDKESKRIWEQCCEVFPSLQNAKILSEKAGLRPTREPVRLEMVSGVKPNQHIIHNYGHGASGITLHWGCANDVNKLVQSLIASKKNSKL